MALFETAFPPAIPFGQRLLSGGEQGTDVAVLQTVYDLMLQVMNPPQGPIGPSVPVTGVYDTATVAMVRNIQSYFGISADGIAGPNTYWLYGQGTGGHTSYGGPVYGSRTLALGAQGGDVTVLQNRLNLFRYATILGAPADGIYGPATAAAVAAFAADANTNGDVGVPTSGIADLQVFNASWIYTFAGGRGLFVGRNGFDVVFLQRLLAQLGLYQGAIDGYYSAATREAVVRFQQAHGLSADGVVGQATFHALGLANPHPAPAPLPIPLLPGQQEVSCCIVLSAAATAQTPAEGTFFIHNGPRSGPDSVALQYIASAFLAAPSDYGADFTRYGLVLNGAPTAEPMTLSEARPDGTGLWTSLFVTGSAGPLEHADVAIVPLTAEGVAGPVAASGSGDCAFPG